MRITKLKAFGIILLCMGIINHLINRLAFAFGGKETTYNIIFCLIGYAGFLIIWSIEDDAP